MTNWYPRFPERVPLDCGKEHISYLAASKDVTQVFCPDFHAFLLRPGFAMWIWLESQAALGTTSFFSHAHQISVLLVHSLWTRCATIHRALHDIRSLHRHLLLLLYLYRYKYLYS
jgi:hypothetical protein